MYAVKGTNLINDSVHYTPCRDYVDACDTLRRVVHEMEAADWVEGEDFTAEVTEVEDDFDFETQPDWN